MTRQPAIPLAESRESQEGAAVPGRLTMATPPKPNPNPPVPKPQPRPGPFAAAAGVTL